MVQDLITAIKVQLYERLTSPLLGALALSFIFWNYRFFLVLFSDDSAIQKMMTIDLVLYPGGWLGADSLLYRMFLPSLTTAFFIYIYPYPAKHVYTFWRNRQKELSDERKRIEGEQLLSKDEARELNRRIYNIEKKYKEEIDHLNGVIESHELTTSENAQQPEFTDLDDLLMPEEEIPDEVNVHPDFDELALNLNETALSIIGTLYSNTTAMNSNDIQNTIRYDRASVSDALNTLNQYEIVGRNLRGDIVEFYLAEKGRQFYHFLRHRNGRA